MLHLQIAWCWRVRSERMSGIPFFRTAIAVPRIRPHGFRDCAGRVSYDFRQLPQRGLKSG